MIFHVDPPSVADAGSEFEIQLRFRKRVRDLAPRVKLVATPNASKRSQWEAGRAKSEGMVAGWPDITALWPGGGVAFIEFKAKTGALSLAQTEQLNWLTNAGFPCGVFRSVDSAVAFLQRCGAPFLFRQEAA